MGVSEYTEDIGNALCALLAQGWSLNRILKTDDGAKALVEVGYEGDRPAMSTVFKWLNDHKSFSENYARAKQESADSMAEEILDISDDGRNDWMEYYDKEGNQIGWRINGEAVQRSKLRVDTRKFLMAKMKPKKYGDKLDLTSGGKRLETTPVIVSAIAPRKTEEDAEAETETTTSS